MPQTDHRTLGDLAKFARVEVESGDIEPWAAVLKAMWPRLGPEGTAWAVKLYNAYDDLGSAFRLFSACSGPNSWPTSWDATARQLARELPAGRERRNLRGGDPNKMTRHLDSYVTALGTGTQVQWLREPLPPGTYAAGFDSLMRHMRRSVWGTGRLAAFEWAEFAGKVLRLPVMPDDGCLWESSGPRESLERIYNGGMRAVSQEQLDGWATECRAYLADSGAALDWWDLETVICDFNVMRRGRYYPGQHIAMIREEIEGLGRGPVRDGLREALREVIPAPWCDVPPGVNKRLAAAYTIDGRIHLPNGTAI